MKKSTAHFQRYSKKDAVTRRKMNRKSKRKTQNFRKWWLPLHVLFSVRKIRRAQFAVTSLRRSGRLPSGGPPSLRGTLTPSYPLKGGFWYGPIVRHHGCFRELLIQRLVLFLFIRCFDKRCSQLSFPAAASRLSAGCCCFLGGCSPFSGCWRFLGSLDKFV